MSEKKLKMISLMELRDEEWRQFREAYKKLRKEVKKE